MVYENRQYQRDLQKYLSDIQEKTKLIETTLEEMDCCILSKIEQLQHVVSEALGKASAYYLESFLSPYTQEYTWISLAAHRLSEKRHGALIVIERNQSLTGVIHNGIPIGAKISPTLLEAIFYPGNPLHDGGVLIKDHTIVSAGNILPLTSTVLNGKKLGTRHRAALALSEQTDALIVIVSEETGKISFAVNGELFVVKT